MQLSRVLQSLDLVMESSGPLTLALPAVIAIVFRYPAVIALSRAALSSAHHSAV
ncbi:hypothetical protein ACFQ95_21725 [Variovorax sp. HJSM1_2]